MTIASYFTFESTQHHRLRTEYTPRATSFFSWHLSSWREEYWTSRLIYDDRIFGYTYTDRILLGGLD